MKDEGREKISYAGLLCRVISHKLFLEIRPLSTTGISKESRNSRSCNNDFTYMNSPRNTMYKDKRDYLSCTSFSSECDQLQAGLMNAREESLNSCSVCAVVILTYCLNRFLWSYAKRVSLFCH